MPMRAPPPRPLMMTWNFFLVTPAVWKLVRRWRAELLPACLVGVEEAACWYEVVEAVVGLLDEVGRYLENAGIEQMLSVTVWEENWEVSKFLSKMAV